MNLPNKWRIGIYLAAIFLAGVATGGVIGFKLGAHMMFRPPSPEGMADRFGGELRVKLALTPEQTQKITGIIRESMSEFGEKLSAQVSSAFSNTNARISAELTPEQQVKFEVLQREREQSMRLHMKEPPAGPTKNP